MAARSPTVAPAPGHRLARAARSRRPGPGPVLEPCLGPVTEPGHGPVPEPGPATGPGPLPSRRWAVPRATTPAKRPATGRRPRSATWSRPGASESDVVKSALVGDRGVV